MFWKGTFGVYVFRLYSAVNSVISVPLILNLYSDQGLIMFRQSGFFYRFWIRYFSVFNEPYHSEKGLGIVFKFRVLYFFIWIHLYAVKWYSLKLIGSECIFDSLVVRYLRLVVMVKWLSISMVLVISGLCLGL